MKTAQGSVLGTSGCSLTPRLPTFCIKPACSASSASCGFLRFLYLFVSLSERLLGSLLHEHLADVCAICAFSQQVITNRRLTSHSVQLDSLCWHGRGQLREGKRWQQLDGTHYGVKERLLSLSDINCNTEKICGKNCLFPFPN